MDTRITLREFSLKVSNKKGTKFHIFYGYDLSKSTPMYYVKASIDGKPASANKAILNRVSKLGIEPINHLISLIGCDETGITANFYDEALNIINEHKDDFNLNYLNVKMITLLRLSDEKNCASDRVKMDKAITKIIQFISKGKSDKAIRGVVIRYLNTHRLRLLLDVRSTAQSLRKLFYKGIELHGNHYTVKKEGYLSEVYYPTYYKRDMDLIRASRIRIYKEVLKKEYVPVKD